MTPGTYIIAEAGVNHNGSLRMAKRLVQVAADAGADAVKFQTFKAKSLAIADAPKADYQLRTTDISQTQYQMLRNLELSRSSHFALVDLCKSLRIQFLSTPFDIESLDLLIQECNVQRIKISSGEITNAPLLLRAAQSRKPVILSTGMSTLEEIETALGVLAFGYAERRRKPSLNNFRIAFASKNGQENLKKNVVLLHCTTEYPTPFEDVHLKAMETMRSSFGLPVGFSDHTEGIAISIAAAAMGAVIIEKHFTLDRNLSGPDQKASLEPLELRKLVTMIRQVERALGTAKKQPTLAEKINRNVIRKSLVANCEIQEGERLTEENLGIKRPGTGIPPLHYWDWLGEKASRKYRRDDLIKP